MLGYFINRSLVMIFGYAYPAFECYKAVEKNRIEIEQLRFWCQYWIIVALLTVSERILDIFVSWLPMYGELKLAFFIYLWYPKTKGTSFVYETFLRPHIAKHETDIDRKLLELRFRAWDLAIFYWQKYSSYCQTSFFQLLHYIVSQSAKMKVPNSQVDPQPPNSPPPPRAMASEPVSDEQTQQPSKNWPSTLRHRSISMSVERSEFLSPKSNVLQEQQPCEIPASDDRIGPPATEEADDRTRSLVTEEDTLDETLRSARTRLRRSISRPN
ncbi:hypothetical protein NE237_008844 [Protea cynaroides]|uniref:HVA22-like protein n=1 Tax=Protea cynaroides TaxID=273540 RepID=A0A9Q0KWU0_9MAGN|nr:hypothetical protein NE237_008844 [Protea cynaroides]